MGDITTPAASTGDNTTPILTGLPTSMHSSSTTLAMKRNATKNIDPQETARASTTLRKLNMSLTTVTMTSTTSTAIVVVDGWSLASALAASWTNVESAIRFGILP